MNHKKYSLLAIVAALFCLYEGIVLARGGFGGGGHGGGGGGGGARGGGGGGHAAAARPAARPSAPNFGGGHSASRPSAASRPSVSRPAVNRPSVASRPSAPQMNRPSGGFKPSTLPSHTASRPATMPGNRPSFDRPNLSDRPGGNRPGAGGRPETRPSVPNLAGGSGHRPDMSFPNRPNSGGGPNFNRPGQGGGSPIANLPNRPGTGRPGGGSARPSPGDVGDFLGMDRPLRPDTRPGGNDRPNISRPGAGGSGTERPGLRPDGNRPDIVRPGGGGSGTERPGLRPDGNRPDIVRPGAGGSGTQRPGLRPDGNRPDIVRPGAGGSGTQRPGFDRPLRPGTNNRPININDVHVGNNNLINKRPTWNNIDRNKINNIGNRWQNQIGGIHNWGQRHPDRMNYWNGWGNGVRNHWGNYGYAHFGNCFGPGWWGNHPHGWCGWHYGYGFNRYPWSYWWTYPSFAGCVNWFNWSAPSAVWSQPVYYDYGSGGNVTYQNDNVYINGEQVATADDFAQSAMTLATVPPPADEAEAAKVEWLPLGTFAVSTSKEDAEPSRVIQLAVSKTGIISGTLFNSKTDQSQSVQGQVDKETQRVAFRVGESQDIVVETGLYNLTQAEAPVLVHFGEDKVENWLLVRLDQPQDEEAANPQ